MFRKVRKYVWIIGSCIIGVVILLITAKSEPKKAVVINDHSPKEVETVEDVHAPVVEPYTIVDVKGEVKNPGVYDVSPDSRIDDVILLAGGFTEKADELQVNKAQKVHDEMMIYVPEIGELNTVPDQVSASADSKKIQLNVATKDEIVELPGIGPSKADAIIQYREENGLFTSVEDLLEVNGIGEKTLENLLEYVQIP